MPSPAEPLFTPPASQACSSQKLPSPDSTEWHAANQQRLELQRGEVEAFNGQSETPDARTTKFIQLH
jgi:hypothetical protein